MANFVRLTAVSVGLVNVLVVGSSGPAFAFAELESSVPVLALVLRAVVAGLVVSEIALRFARPALQGGFLLRCGIVVSAVCLGGLIFGASLLLGALFDGSVPVEGVLVAAALGAVFGLALGAAEGLVLPLAALLGRLRS